MKASNDFKLAATVGSTCEVNATLEEVTHGTGGGAAPVSGAAAGFAPVAAYKKKRKLVLVLVLVNPRNWSFRGRKGVRMVTKTFHCC